MTRVHSPTSLLCSCHLSFLVWVLTSLILGVQDPASGLHATRSLLSSGTRTRCCCLLQCFPVGYVQAGFIITLGSTMLPLRPREGFPAGGTWTGSAVFGSCSTSGFCILFSNSPPETEAGAQLNFLGSTCHFKLQSQRFAEHLGHQCSPCWGSLCPCDGP